MPDELELFCPHCQEAEVCGPTQMLARLRSVGALRREADPPPSLLEELFRHTAAKFTCHGCNQPGLQVRKPAVEQWDTVRRCSQCGTRLPNERLELYPTAERCAQCEGKLSSQTDAEPEFCSRCGEVMTMRLRRGAGIAKYELTCPRCRA